MEPLTEMKRLEQKSPGHRSIADAWLPEKHLSDYDLRYQHRGPRQRIQCI